MLTFNRTIMELKWGKHEVELQASLAFNRTIMELKYIPVRNDGMLYAAFNRTIMELKYASYLVSWLRNKYF